MYEHVRDRQCGWNAVCGMSTYFAKSEKNYQKGSNKLMRRLLGDVLFEANFPALDNCKI